MTWNTIPETERAQLNTRLTQRQHHVYALWLAGCSLKTISEYLNISQRTVRTHLERAKAVHALIAKEAA